MTNVTTPFQPNFPEIGNTFPPTNEICIGRVWVSKMGDSIELTSINPSASLNDDCKMSLKEFNEIVDWVREN